MTEEELNQSLNDSIDLAGEDELQRDILPAHNYKSNLSWMIAVISTVSPTNEDVLRALIVSSFATHDQFKTKIHVFIQGDFAGGKTQKAETVRGLLPIKNRVREKVFDKSLDVQCVSPKAPFYSTLNKIGRGKDAIPNPTLYANRVLYLDDVKVSDIEPLKQLTNTSNEVPAWSVTSKDNDGTKTMLLDGKPTIWVSKVDGFNNEQAKSRFFTANIVKDVATVDSYMKKVYSESILKEQKDNLELVRCFIASRIGLNIPVVAVQAHRDMLPIPKESNRNTAFMLTALECIAKINAIDISKPIIPTDIDIKETIAMFKCDNASVQMHGCSKGAMQLLQFITSEDIDTKAFDNNQDQEGATVKSLLNRVPDSERTIRRLIVELESCDKIEVKPNRCNKKYFRKVN